MCPSMWAHWRHLANMIELVLFSAHPTPQPKRQIDRFSRFCTTHGRKSLYFTMGDPFPKNCPFSWGIWTSWFLGPFWAHNPNGITIGSGVYTQVTAECPFYKWDARSPSKLLPISMGRSGPHLIHGSLSPPKSSTQAASRSVQPFVQSSLVWQTDRQTDGPRYSVGNNRPHLRATRSKN